MQIKQNFSNRLLSLKSDEIYSEIENLSLFHLKGIDSKPLFVSTLLHGNETTGFYAVLDLLKDLQGDLPRDLILLIGNVTAAKDQARHLPEQPDFNRIWGVDGNRPEYRRAREIVDYLRKLAPFAAIDLHNSTGRNPAYAAVNSTEPATLALAASISSRTVFFKEPHTTLSGILSSICPSLTFEAGISGDLEVQKRVTIFLRDLLQTGDFPKFSEEQKTVSVFHSHARIIVPEHFSFTFGEGAADIRFDSDLDLLNFEKVKVGCVFARCTSASYLTVLNEAGDDIFDEYFERADGCLQVKKEFTPSLITTDANIVRQDILGYIMRSETLPTGG